MSVFYRFTAIIKTTAYRKVEFCTVTDCSTHTRQAMQWVRQFVADLSMWMPGFNPRTVHEGLVVDKVTLKHVLL
jgi:hypothetical protein